MPSTTKTCVSFPIVNASLGSTLLIDIFSSLSQDFQIYQQHLHHGDDKNSRYSSFVGRKGGERAPTPFWDVTGSECRVKLHSIVTLNCFGRLLSDWCQCTPSHEADELLDEQTKISRKMYLPSQGLGSRVVRSWDRLAFVLRSGVVGVLPPF